MAKVQYKFDPFKLVNVSKRGLAPKDKEKILSQVQDFVLEKVLEKVGSQESPVSGQGSFKALKKSYKELKSKEGGTPIPNLELTGSMLDSLKITRQGDKLILTVSEDEMDKADNHNKFSAKSKATPVPARKFIPNEKEGETFKKDIITGIKSILEDAEE